MADGDGLPARRNRSLDLLKNGAEAVYFEALRELSTLSDELDNCMFCKCDAVTFRDKLDNWMVALDDVKYAEREWCRYLEGETKQEVLRRSRGTLQTYLPLKDKSCEYIELLLANSPASGGVRGQGPEASAEVRRLGREIAQLSRNMSRTQVDEAHRVDSTDGDDGRLRVGEEAGPTGQEQVAPRTDASEPSVISRGYSSVDSDRSLVHQLANVLDRQQQRDRLPKVEPEVFKGDLLKFPLWWTTMSVMLDSDLLTCQEKLLYLIQYTGEPVTSTISWYVNQQDKTSAYVSARNAIVEKYGDRIKISRAYRQRLYSWPSIQTGDIAGLQKYSDFLWQCLSAVDSVGYLDSLCLAEENPKMAEKLPEDARRRWNRNVVDSLYPEREGETSSYPTLRKFCEFVAREVRINEGPCAPKPRSRSEPAPPRGRRSAQTMVGLAQPRNRSSTPSKPTPAAASRRMPPRKTKDQQEKECGHCSKGHHISKCADFLKKPREEKKDIAGKLWLCFGCLYSGHNIRDCTGIDRSLMYDTPAGQPKPEGAPSADAAPQKNENVPAKKAFVNNLLRDVLASTSNMSLVVPVVVLNPHTKKATETYAALDTQSNTTFGSRDLLDRLQCELTPCSMDVRTMVGQEVKNTAVAVGLQVRGIDWGKIYTLPPTYRGDSLPSNRDMIPRKSDLREWPHLEKVLKQMRDYDPRLKVELLIGYDMHEAFFPSAVVTKDVHSPFAVKSIFGWGIMGPRDMKQVYAAPTTRRNVKDISYKDIDRVFNGDFELGGDPEIKFSQQDLRFLELMDSGVRQQEDGHLSLPLPVKEPERQLPNSRRTALKRLDSLKRRLDRDPEFRSQYVEFVMEMLRNGHAEKVSPAENGSAVWYLPHQGVKHPRKPGVVRVVYDGSAETEGVSLNSLLLSGPDLNNSLLGVLVRFRLGLIGFTCDIEKMFLQVRVNQEHRDMLRFFFFPDGDTSQAPEEYRVTVHLFGATSSPAVATYALRRVAELYRDQFDPVVVQFIMRHFYVDDGLGSGDTEEEVLALIQGSHQICSKGGFRLHKYVCSNRAVMEKIPEELRAKSVQSMDMNLQTPGGQVTLGMMWSLEDDCWKFCIKPHEQPLTRRGTLSALSAIYDPLGLVSPVLLVGRNLLQQICQEKYSWDDPLNPELSARWSEWYEQLIDLEALRIPRCYRSQVLNIELVEYHIFADASCSGYGACGYVLFRDADGEKVDTSLVMAKSKVHPTRATTIPRMELQAAVLAVQLMETMKRELPYQKPRIFLWSDSKITLGYLGNDARRFHVYVSNRVQYIRDRSDADSWRYVRSEDNPADLASRGVTAVELLGAEEWWKGPQCMVYPSEPAQPEIVGEDDPEVRKVSVFLSQQHTTRWRFSDSIERVSSWPKMVNYTAIWRRFVRQALHVIRREPKENLPKALSVRERREAQELLVRTTQMDYLTSTYALLQKGVYPNSKQEARTRKEELKGCTNLFKLDPYLDGNGLMRVGGRIRRGSFPNNLKHPCLLPPASPVARALALFHHQRTVHAGVSHTLGSLREAGWWICKSRRVISTVIRDCVVCSRFKSGTLTQKMADLPADRITENPPFTYCGVDLVGPILVKERRSDRKRWICLFTCLVIRAVHLEVCEDLSTDAFIGAYRRFVGRRGPVLVLRSDMGTNIMGARGELARQLDGLDQERLAWKLSEAGCDYVRFEPNVPRAPHMGGVWERLVKSVKSVMSRILFTQNMRLDDWALLTLVIEIESIINSRPLSYLSVDDTSQPTPLTPARLLTMKEWSATQPTKDTQETDLYGRRRWKQAQYLSQQFWNRWREEYLPLLQQRSKWLDKHENVRVGDVVLVQEDQPDRSRWPLGRVLDVRKSEDGLVRSVTVKTRAGTYQRPIRKLIPLVRGGDAEDQELM